MVVRKMSLLIAEILIMKEILIMQKTLKFVRKLTML